MEFISKDKYFSMKRAYERLKKISTNNGNSISTTDAKDATEEFFNQCYHFKDWLKKDTSFLVSQNIEEFINKNNPLSLAADYCNSFKHAGLNQKPRSNTEIEKINTHTIFDLTPTGFIAFSRLELTISGKKHDAFSLATDCINAWDEFLTLNKVKFVNP